MPRSSDDRLLVLHGLRLKGFALADAIAEQVGVGAATVTSVLGELEADGLVQYRDGRLTGWALTTEGRREHERSLNDELNEAGCREDVLGAYKRFLALNHELLELCTRWQLREVGGEQIMNDHSDTAHDAAVLDDLAALHARVEPICADLAALFDRFGAYGERLSGALARVRGGELDYFTKPIMPSYHTIWFELHEDLLATLGIDRATEAVH